MLSSTSLSFKQAGRVMPVRPISMPHHLMGNKSCMHTVAKFWDYTLRSERKRTSFWVSDFKHKYLIRTGRYYTGKIPESPPPGYFKGVNDVDKYLEGHPKPEERETRHLPVMPLTARVVYEHRVEAEDAYFTNKIRYKKILRETREVEFHNWYSRAQRVRGRWCREQGITSRGIYSPAVDASEIFG